MPGTDTNVTPDIGAPIIARAAIYHFDFLEPLKKAELSLFEPAIHAMLNMNSRYAQTVIIITSVLILQSTIMQK